MSTSIMRTMSLRFRLRPKRKNAPNKPIIIRAHVFVDFARNEKIFSTGLKVMPENWCVSSQQMIGGDPTLRAFINNQLMILRQRFNAAFIQLQLSGNHFTNADLIDFVKKNKAQKPTFREVAEEYFKEEFVRKNFEKITQNKRKIAHNQICSILSELGHNELKINEFTRKIVTDVYYKLLAKTNKAGDKIQPLHAFRTLKHIDRVLDFATKEDYITTNPWVKFGVERPQDVRREILYLSELQVNKLYNLQSISLHQRQVIDIFVFLCFTGFTHADFKEFIAQPKAFITDDNGYLFIEKRRFKTRKDRNAVVPHIPLFPIANEILERYDYELPLYSIQEMNRELKLLCRRIGVLEWKKVTTYLARKTAATMIANFDGVEIKTVSKFLGHKSSKTTIDHYAVTTDDTVKRQLIPHVQPKKIADKPFTIYRNIERIKQAN